MFEHSIIPKEMFVKIPNNKPLIILGMHRSGTSLLANWLHQCGFNLGDKMLGAGNGNDEGHFEDLHVYQLHEQILQHNRTDYLASSSSSLNISKEAFLSAQKFYDEKKDNDCWGWKEPRTCLMMDIWNQIIPSYKTIVLYRDFNQVVDSLIRRKQKAVKSLLEMIIQEIKYLFFKRQTANRLLKAWIEYNQSILKNIDNQEYNSFLIINESKLFDINYQLYKYLQENWGYKNIHYVSFKAIFKPQLLRRETAKYKFDPNLLKEAIKITTRLDKLEYNSILKLLLT